MVLALTAPQGVSEVEQHLRQHGVTNIVRVDSNVSGDLSFYDGGATHGVPSTASTGFAYPPPISPELTQAMQRIAAFMEQQVSRGPSVTPQLDALTEAIRELSERIDDLAHKE